jgi:hypothetical protein
MEVQYDRNAPWGGPEGQYLHLEPMRVHKRRLQTAKRGPESPHITGPGRNGPDDASKKPGEAASPHHGVPKALRSPAPLDDLNRKSFKPCANCKSSIAWNDQREPPAFSRRAQTDESVIGNPFGAAELTGRRQVNDQRHDIPSLCRITADEQPAENRTAACRNRR